MGLFGGSKKIVVSSTVYNMAGDDDANRPQFLKSVMFSTVMNSNKNVYFGESIVGSYLRGPGINQRSLFNYAKRKEFAGMPTFTTSNSFPVSGDVVKPFIPLAATPAGLQTAVQRSYVSNGDYEIFAERWILNNKPEMILDNWTVEYFKDIHSIIIQYSGGDTDVISAGSYNPRAQFVIAHYYQFVPNAVESLVVGVEAESISSGDAPSTVDYALVSTTNTGLVNYNLSYSQTEDVSYSDGSPGSSTTRAETETIPYNGLENIYSKTEFMGSDGASDGTTNREYILSIKELRTVVQDTSSVTTSQNMGGGVIKTTVTTKTGNHLVPLYRWRTDTQDTISEKADDVDKIYIYKIGGANATLNALVTNVNPFATKEFFPFIPVRLNNKSIREPEYEASGLLDDCMKIYRRSTKGQSFDDLVDQVEENESLNEIDYAYVQYGASLNTTEPTAKRYIYQFLKTLIPYQTTSGDYMSQYMSEVGSYNSQRILLEAWQTAQSNPFDPLYGEPKPTVPELSSPIRSEIRLQTNDPSLLDFDNRISWISINEEIIQGQAKAGVKKNECWIETSGSEAEGTFWDIAVGHSFGGESSGRTQHDEADKTTIYWQDSATSYKKLTCWGMYSANFIYGGRAVYINASEALTDPDPSGFLIPLHMPTLRNISLVDATQMATANTFMVFNSYKVYKKKWYQTFLGQLFIFIAIIVVASIAAPALMGSAGGILGTNAAVGASFGLTGLAATVAGAVANALVATIVTRAISEVSVAVFGEKWGAIIGSIASFAVNFGMANGFSNITMTTMMQPQNLLAMSSALANGYSGYVQANIMEIQGQMTDNQNAYDKKSDEINQKMKELGGQNGLFFDAMQLTDAGAGNDLSTLGSYIPEGFDSFIQRTMMTGSDIVDVTISAVTDYPQLANTLPKPDLS